MIYMELTFECEKIDTLIDKLSRNRCGHDGLLTANHTSIGRYRMNLKEVIVTCCMKLKYFIKNKVIQSNETT